MEDFPLKLENNEFTNEQALISDSPDPGNQDYPDHVYIDESSTPVNNESPTPIHYILPNPKSDRSNPILREKALKALKQVTVSTHKSVEILIHELPRDIIGKLIYDPSSINKTTRMNEEQRDQVQKMNQFISGSNIKKTAGISSNSTKLIVLFNHKDNQIDLFYSNK